MLSSEQRQLLPTSDERKACQLGVGKVCHGIDDGSGISDVPETLYSDDRDALRQTIDWVSNHCQTFQINKDQRAGLPCMRVKQTIIWLNE